ncbi:MAG: hypothetical protein GXP19_09175 [Gammaproteobacteria bacterium]|nr:hypothetical protein [Gammaproteobacteria bacterium]
MSQSGGCACGAIRYETTAAAEFTIICQCRQCQRISGSGHGAAFAVNAESTATQGDVKPNTSVGSTAGT